MPEPDSQRPDALPPPPPIEDDQPFRLIDYVIVNGLFLGFLLVVYLGMRAIFANSAGLSLFFLMLAGGFVLVSVYDFIFDRVYTPPSGDSPGGGPQTSA